MSIQINNAIAEEIINNLKEKIDAESIDTWQYEDDDENITYFFHITKEKQWDNFYFFCEEETNEYIVFSLESLNEEEVSHEISSTLHGRFTSLILGHCEGLFDTLYLP